MILEVKILPFSQKLPSCSADLFWSEASVPLSSCPTVGFGSRILALIVNAHCFCEFSSL